MPVASEGTSEQRTSQLTQPAEPSTLVHGDPGVAWVRSAPSQAQVVRTVAVALLTAAVVLGFFLFGQVRTFIGWFVIALFLGTVLNQTWIPRPANMGFRCVKEVK